MKLSYDTAAVMRGLEKFKADPSGTLPYVSEGMGLALQIQEELFERKAAENLARTEAFFKDISNKADVVKVVENQLCFERLQCGHGTATVQKESEPLVHYTAKTFEDIVVSDTHVEGRPVRIPLFETIPGFSRAVEGMLVGEKRKIYVHPNMAYKRGGFVPPNSVIIFEVEVLEI